MGLLRRGAVDLRAGDDGRGVGAVDRGFVVFVAAREEGGGEGSCGNEGKEEDEG